MLMITKSEELFNRIIYNFEDRSLFNGIDDDIKEEIKEELRELIEEYNIIGNK